MWNSIVSVSDHCFIICSTLFTKAKLAKTVLPINGINRYCRKVSTLIKYENVTNILALNSFASQTFKKANSQTAIVIK